MDIFPDNVAIAAIQERTENLPDDPADASVIASASATTDAAVVSAHGTTDALIASEHVTTDALIASEHTATETVVTNAHVTTDAGVVSAHGTTDTLIASEHVTTDALVTSSHSTTGALVTSSHSTTDALIASEHVTTDALVTSSHSTTDALISSEHVATQLVVTSAHTATDADLATLDAKVVVVDGYHDVPSQNATTNAHMRDVQGNKTDAANRTANQASTIGLLRQILDEATEVLEHHHSGERWFGAAAAPDGETHIADRIGAGAAGAEAGPLIVDAGNDDWGAWTQILGSSDTPTDGGAAVAFDIHRLRGAAAEDATQRYLIQIAFQEDAPADDPGSSDTYTEIEGVSRAAAATASREPIILQSPRVAASTKVWMRTWAPDQNTSTLSFYFGLHEYFSS